MVNYLEEMLDEHSGELPISAPLVSKYHSIGVIHTIANIGAVVGALSGLAYSQLANSDPLPTVAKGLAYGLAIPYIVLTTIYAMKDKFKDISDEI